MERDATSIKSLSSDFPKRVCKILDDIDIIKQETVLNQSKVIFLGERLHALFILLSKKLTDESDIKTQLEFNDKQNQTYPIVTLRVNRKGVPCQPYDGFNIKKLAEYLKVLQEREMNLLRLIEKLEVESSKY